MTVPGYLATARVYAEAQMVSACRIFSVGPPVTDPESGEVTFPEVDPVRTPCRVRPNSRLQGSESETGGAELLALGYIVSVPFAVSPKVLQRLVIESSPDPALVDLSLEIRQVPRGDRLPARRLLCEEVA